MSPAPRWPFGPDTRICVSLAERDASALRRRFGRLDGADLVEIRLDALDAPLDLGPRGLVDLVESCPLPVGFTLRPPWQGGRFEGDEPSRRRCIEQAAAAGAAFVDVEIEAEWVADFLDRADCPVIVSHHWHCSRPPDLAEKVARIAALAPSMAKLVAIADVPSDALPLLGAGEQLIASGQPATCFCMGEAGKASRLLAAGRGAALVYAAATVGSEVAAGQWSLRELVEELRVCGWRRGTGFCGLIGHPIGHSLSPAIFNAVFQARGLDVAYVPVAGEDLDGVLDLAIGMGFRGVSVTMPFKQEIASRSARRDEVVTAIGAANTVVFEGDRLAAYNTDGGAVVAALVAVRPVEAARIAVVGAGGAARAGATALVGAGADVTILNRTEARAREAAELAGAKSAGLEQLDGGDFDIVINATPVGMQGTPMAESTPFPPEWLSGGEVVFDMVYRPRTTPLLRQAAGRGCTTIEGLEMFIRQAAAQFRILTGDTGVDPLDMMREVVERLLANDRVSAQEAPDGGTDLM